MSITPTHPPHPLWLRIATRACPTTERPWLAALFAESFAAGSAAGRLGWLAGAAGLIAAAHTRRGLAALRAHPASAVSLALLISVVLALPSLLGYELMAIEDDYLLMLSTLLGGGTVLATAYALLLDNPGFRVLPNGRP